MQKTNKISLVFLVIVGLAFLSIAIPAFINPQSIMDNVQVTLGNTSALNSVRAMYGGVNLFFGLYILYAAFKKQETGLILVFLYCAGFMVGRIYSLFAEGNPSQFIITWLCIESTLTILSILLLRKLQKKNLATQL
ncbi:MAG TPA: DUF4345 domain-containing protein [Chitinophagales bacterium]|jgi:uncharacterized membrane protein|nr:DUF4345 domain-containing protein [Chitinophagales bacterium]